MSANTHAGDYDPAMYSWAYRHHGGYPPTCPPMPTFQPDLSARIAALEARLAEVEARLANMTIQPTTE
jgi:hypothetical protein